MKLKAGALMYDLPRFLLTVRRGRWPQMRNRREGVSSDGRGVRCDWEFTSDLHIAKVFPSAGARLMRVAFADAPYETSELHVVPGITPDVSFVIGHRGEERLAQLLSTLRSIGGQTGANVECIVVEQSPAAGVLDRLPAWVRGIHQPVAQGDPYNRSAAFNFGAARARGNFLIFHDNDMIVPRSYAAEVVKVAAEGWQAIDLKRFIFYLDAAASAAFQKSALLGPLAPSIVRQNARGGSTAVTRETFENAGRFDEQFIGWGGEDNDFWDRIESVGRAYRFGYLPMIHLHHESQAGKADSSAPAVRRYHELVRSETVEARIRRLRERAGPAGGVKS